MTPADSIGKSVGGHVVAAFAVPEVLAAVRDGTAEVLDEQPHCGRELLCNVLNVFWLEVCCTGEMVPSKAIDWHRIVES